MAVWFVLMLGLSLPSLFSPVPDPQIKNLAQIIQLLRNEYGYGDCQFAMAFNTPASMCDPGVNPDQIFLDVDRDNVYNTMNSPSRLFVSDKLISAKPKQIPKTSNSYHSEYLLLVKSNPPNKASNDPLVKNLLNKDQRGCVLFYTYNSPCVNTCSTPRKPYSIIPALDMFTYHKGPKAFVFTRIWKYDEGTSQWRDNIKEVNARVPLYRCDNKGCIPCVKNNNVEKWCLYN